MTAPDLSSQIAKNLAYWAPGGPGAAQVRRDRELVDEVARADLKREAEASAVAEYYRKIALPEPEAVKAADDYADRWFAWVRDDVGCLGDTHEDDHATEEDRKFAFDASGVFAVHCIEETGRVADSERLTKAQREAETLARMSKDIADKMTAAGWNAYRDTPFELWRYYVHSRHVEKLPSYRRCVFIPAIGQAVRAPMVSALEFFLSRNLFCRFWTFSSGQRVVLSEVRRRVQYLHKRLKKLNAQDFMREAGVRMVFRSTELGTPEMDAAGNARDGGRIERNDAGEVCFHVHAHVVVELSKGFIAPEKWSALVAKVGTFWRHWWGEGGVIQSARECCKYVTKPAEMLKLSGEELIALQGQLSRLKLVQPLGSLAAEIEAREAAGKRLVKKTTKEGKVHVVVSNWNKHAKRTKTQAAQDAAGKLPDRWDSETYFAANSGAREKAERLVADGVCKDVCEAAKYLARLSGEKVVTESTSKARGLCRVVSRGVPRFGPAGVSEPAVCVMTIKGSWSEQSVRDHPLVSPLINLTAWRYQVGLADREAAARISVHTRTPTVPAVPAKPRGKPRTQPFWASELVPA